MLGTLQSAEAETSLKGCTGGTVESVLTSSYLYLNIGYLHHDGSAECANASLGLFVKPNEYKYLWH